MDGYECDGDPKEILQNGEAYTIQYYRGKHKNECVMRTSTGDACLYENGVMKMRWKENKNGMKHDEFVVYKRGRVDFRQNFKDIIEQNDYFRIVNHKKGPRLEITDFKTGNYIYHGKFDNNFKKDGWGVECDRENGQMILEGIWSKGELIEIIRLFDGDTMTELRRNGADNLDPLNRFPVYVGEFRYDADSETFVREGVGCLIDEKTRIATRECEWRDGKEVSGVNLRDGWYCPQSVHVDRSNEHSENNPTRDHQLESTSTRDHHSESASKHNPPSESVYKKDNHSESVYKKDNQPEGTSTRDHNSESVYKKDHHSESASKHNPPSESIYKKDNQPEGTSTKDHQAEETANKDSRSKDASGNKPLCRPSHTMSSKSLRGSILYSNDLNTVSTTITELKVSSYCCNDLDLLDLNKFASLQSIEIGSRCFESVHIFRIDALHKLSRLIIGRESFTAMKRTEKFEIEKANDKSKSFHILNCESLESIEIGEFCFADYAGKFELKNLPKLHTIQIGSIEHRSYNFYFASFIVKGIFPQ